MKKRSKNRTVKTVFVLLIIFVGAAFAGCKKKADHVDHDAYSCPMHPKVVQDHPGSCPVCGMDLVLKKPAKKTSIVTPDVNELLKPANASVVSAIRTISPREHAFHSSRKANGTIVYDSKRLTSVTSRVSGRIEKLFVKYNFQPVLKGQIIYEIFSPDLVTAQEDFLYVLKSDAQNAKLIEAGRQKLILLGATITQINNLISSGKSSRSFAVQSPVSGYVVERSDPGNNPTERATTESRQSALKIKEGSYVEGGEEIFDVVDTGSVWAEFNVPSAAAGGLKVNEPVEVSFDNSNETSHGRISLIQPFYGQGEKFSQVRVPLDNAKKKLNIGQWVYAGFPGHPSRSLWIPASAKTTIGTRQVVFVKKGQAFLAQQVVCGASSGDQIEILKGVTTKDSLAYQAAYLVDGDSFIKISNSL